MLYIDPEVCIDCEACVPKCPVEAIFLDQRVPEQWRPYIEENARRAPGLPIINRRKEKAGE